MLRCAIDEIGPKTIRTPVAGEVAENWPEVEPVVARRRELEAGGGRASRAPRVGEDVAQEIPRARIPDREIENAGASASATATTSCPASPYMKNSSASTLGSIASPTFVSPIEKMGRPALSRGTRHRGSGSSRWHFRRADPNAGWHTPTRQTGGIRNPRRS